MAKKGKKGKKGKKKKTPKIDPNALTEVDKTFYELTIADLNRKLARLRSLTQDLEQKNEELRQELDKMDEDRSDIINFLKRMLEEKTNEIRELEDRITALQETIQNDTDKYETKIEELENEYTNMKEQLTSENKLLEGKLNSLEEFRSQRDELMKKFEQQEKDMEAQEKRHTRELYEIERKFIIAKDKLKKDMEARLLQLSTEFHDASELRIAATTHRVIRENITVNNELDVMMTSHQKLINDVNTLNSRDKTLRQQAELHEAEKKKALLKVQVQMQVINRLTHQHKFMSELVEKYKHFENEILSNRNAVKVLNEKNASLEFKIKLLEQNLEKSKSDQISMKTEVDYLSSENKRLKDILFEGVSCIKEALTVKTESDQSLRASKRENLLSTLFVLLNKAQEQKIQRPSLQTITSIDSAYERGDLGFVPKSIEDIRPIARTRRHMESQTGISFDRYLETGASSDSYVEEFGEDEVSQILMTLQQLEDEEEDEEMVKKVSVLFFDENEGPEEEHSQEGSRDYDPFADALSSEPSHLSIQSEAKPKGTPTGSPSQEIKAESSPSSKVSVSKQEASAPGEGEDIQKKEGQGSRKSSKTSLADAQKDGSKEIRKSSKESMGSRKSSKLSALKTSKTSVRSSGSQKEESKVTSKESKSSVKEKTPSKEIRSSIRSTATIQKDD